MKMRALFAVVAVLLSFGAVRDEANADAILFPWVVTSDTVVTIVSVVNHTDAAAADRLHLAYFYKQTVDNTNTECCNGTNFEVPTTFEDVVSFDVNAQLVAKGGPLFNDGTDYAGANFAMDIERPRRAFLIVDNGVYDGEGRDSLYGEAMVVELGAGAAWGYRAYNSADTDWLNPYFGNEAEVHGEVLAAGERTPVTLLPPSNWVTRFIITPIGDAAGGQAYSGYNASFQIKGVDATSHQGIAMWDRDENPVSGAIPQNIVCTGAVDFASSVLLSEGSYNRIENQGGWAFADVSVGTLIGDCAPSTPIIKVDEVCVLKLEHNLGGAVGGVSVPGIVNSAVWLEVNTGGIAAIFGF